MSILRKAPGPGQPDDLRTAARIEDAVHHLDTHLMPYLTTLRRSVGTTGQPNLADVADETTNLLLDLRTILTGGA